MDLIGAGMGLLGGITGAISGKNAAKRQYTHEKEMMGLQHQYNEKSADTAQERAKDMWDYTNYESQVEHMKNAGLSVGLMYGNGGGMIASSSGAQGQGVTQTGTKSEEIRTQRQMMGLSMAQIASQIAVNKSQEGLNNSKADEAKANAEKTKGVDTEATKTGIEETLSRIDNNKVQNMIMKQNLRNEMANEALIEATIDEKNANIDYIKWQGERARKEVLKTQIDILNAGIDYSIKEQCLNDIVKQQKLTTAQMIKNLSKTNAEIGEIQKRIENMTDQITDRHEGRDIEWEKLKQDYEKMLQELDLNGEKIKQEYIGIIAGALSSIASAAAAAKILRGGGAPVIKGFGK